MKKFNLDITQFPITETENFCGKYNHPTLKSIVVKNVKNNPQNKRVCFLEVDDPKVLNELINYFDKKPISPTHISRNHFAVYKFQLTSL
jgi:hypothetical protein